MLSPASWQALNFISDPFCDMCGLPLEIAVFDHTGLLCGGCTAEPKIYRQARAAVKYDDASRQLILAFKHGDQMHLTLTFVPWLRRAGHELIKDADLILPVPLHWLRLLKRRYNQSAILAERLSRETGVAHDPDLLKRTRHTPVQGHLSSKDRYKNVRDAFSVRDKTKILNKKIILIDDVYTTGATVQECTEVLYAAGAGRVDVLTVARVSRPDNIS